MANKMIDPMIPSLFHIERLRKETKDTFTLELSPKNGAKHFQFLPGQFNMLYVFGVGEVPISISGNPFNGDPLRHTTRVVGTVTKAMGKLKTGDTIGIRGPFGSPWPVNKVEGKDVVFIAGGIGLAPLRPAIYQVIAERQKYGKVVLLYGTRDPEDILFKPELKEWKSKFDLDVFITVDRAVGKWSGNVGVVTTLIPRAPFHPPNTAAFICGPEVMMHFTVQSLKQRGLNERDIYVSMERNMKCAVGFCGHCQYGPYFICKDGPVFSFDRIKSIFRKSEV